MKNPNPKAEKTPERDELWEKIREELSYPTCFGNEIADAIRALFSECEVAHADELAKVMADVDPQNHLYASMLLERDQLRGQLAAEKEDVENVKAHNEKLRDQLDAAKAAAKAAGCEAGNTVWKINDEWWNWAVAIVGQAKPGAVMRDEIASRLATAKAELIKLRGEQIHAEFVAASNSPGVIGAVAPKLWAEVATQLSAWEVWAHRVLLYDPTKSVLPAMSDDDLRSEISRRYEEAVNRLARAPVGREAFGGYGAVIRAEIALVSGVVQALATSRLADWQMGNDCAKDCPKEWERAEKRLVRLLAQERELMGGELPDAGTDTPTTEGTKP